jgi:hypothetical protein
VNGGWVRAAGAARQCAPAALVGRFWGDPSTSPLGGRKVTLTRTFRLIIASSAVLAVASCDLAAGEDEAKALADRYFAASEKGDYDGILSLYSKQFLAKTSATDTRQLLVKVHEQCGVPKSHTLKNWRAFSNFSNGSVEVDLLYEVTYSRCQINEGIRVVRPENGKAQILSHHFNVTQVSHAPTTA